jgi:hypothetical protein
MKVVPNIDERNAKIDKVDTNIDGVVNFTKKVLQDLVLPILSPMFCGLGVK